jgi:hypothetical protein
MYIYNIYMYVHILYIYMRGGYQKLTSIMLVTQFSHNEGYAEYFVHTRTKRPMTIFKMFLP